MAVVEELKPKIRPCAGPCKRMSRPSSTPAASAPGTVARRRRGMCVNCLHLTGDRVMPAHIGEERLEQTVASLDRYLERRRDRIYRMNFTGNLDSKENVNRDRIERIIHSEDRHCRFIKLYYLIGDGITYKGVLRLLMELGWEDVAMEFQEWCGREPAPLEGGVTDPGDAPSYRRLG